LIGYHFKPFAKPRETTQHPAKTPALHAPRSSHIFIASTTNPLRVLDDGGLQTLGVLNVDGLHVRVQLLLGALLVVSLTGDADAQTERNALDAGFPNLLVELGVEADVLGALIWLSASVVSRRPDGSMGQAEKDMQHTIDLVNRDCTYHGLLSEVLDLLDRLGSLLLECSAVDLVQVLTSG